MTDRRVVLASGNRGKLKELQHRLDGIGLALHSQAEFDVPEAAETGLTFVENALIKARNAARHSGLPAIADDSGLSVDVLDGRPGIYSARFAGEAAGDADNNRKLLELLRDVPEERRGAEFFCALVLLRHPADPCPVICEGRWRGRILEAPRGHNGFGYDPLFWVPERHCSSAELPPEEKNRISHRGQALTALIERLRRQPL